jgi:hypothetical protein
VGSPRNYLVNFVCDGISTQRLTQNLGHCPFVAHARDIFVAIANFLQHVTCVLSQERRGKFVFAHAAVKDIGDFGAPDAALAGVVFGGEEIDVV